MRISDLVEAVQRDGRAVVVMITEARGSAPREAGAAMLVSASGAVGTIGGGAVEYRAQAIARDLMADMTPAPASLDFPLGPALDQCCGGRMQVAFACFDAADLDFLRAADGELELWPGGPVLIEAPPPRPVMIYGGGHVGAALARALAPLPFTVRWVDARLDGFPAEIPVGVETVQTPLPEVEAKAAPADALHVVLTHSHALDLEIVAAVLERGEFGFLGLIGSGTKKALFLRRLRERGIPEARLARLTCPVGLPGIRDKRPEVIAAAVAVQLLQAARTAVQTNRESA
jgi:xanthine dehydrogenase accessory factor